MITMLRIAVAIALVTVPMASGAWAQDTPAPVAEFAAGWVGFADDGIVNETLVGGAARWYLLSRIAIGPELIYIAGDNHSHFVATANLTWDILGPVNGRPRAITPFVVVGGGLFQSSNPFPTGTFTSREGAFTLGGGVRVSAGDRLSIGLDTRIGWETHLRVNGTVGVRLGQ